MICAEGLHFSAFHYVSGNWNNQQHFCRLNRICRVATLCLLFVCMWTGRLDGTPEGQVAVIARMNITLFEEMVKTVRSGRSLRLGFAGVSQPCVWYAHGREYKGLYGLCGRMCVLGIIGEMILLAQF